VLINGEYVYPSDIEGPTEEEIWRAHQNNRRDMGSRSSLAHYATMAAPNMQSYGGLRDRSPRITKHRGGSIEGVRIK
jgi:hypothetical protein